MARQRMTRSLFDSCKKFQMQGLSISGVASIVQMSTVTIGRVFRSETYEDYTAIIAGNHPHTVRTETPERRVKYKVEVTVWEYQY